MPSGSSEHQLRSTDRHAPAAGRYGRPGFVAAFVNILALEFLLAVCALAWYTVPIIVIPALIADALVAYGLTRARGSAAQVGRGMLVGCTAVLLTLLLFIPGYLVAHLLGPV